MGRWVRFAVSCIMIIGTACGPGGAGTRYSGEVIRAAESGPPGSDRWVLLVKLDKGTVASSDVVQVAFDLNEIACGDDSPISPSEVPVGTHVTFIRVGDDADAMAPPAIGGRRVRVDCRADTGGSG